MNLSWRTVFVSPFVELPFMVLLTWAWIRLIGVDASLVLGAILVCKALRYLLLSGVLWRFSSPIDRWRETGASDEQLLRADLALQSMPWRGSMVVGGSWGLLHVVEAMVVSALNPGFIGSSEFATSVLVGVCAGGASSAFAYLFFTVFFERERVDLAVALDERGLPRRAPRASIGVRVAALIAAICLAPTGLFSAMARVGFVRAARSESAVGLSAALDAELARLDAGEERVLGRIVETSQLYEAPPGLHEQLPPVRHRVRFDRARGQLSVAARVGGEDSSSWLVIEGPVEQSERFTVLLSVFIATLVLFLAGAALMVARSLSSPLRQLEASMRRLIEVGDVRSIPHAPVLQNDEFGALSVSFNALVDSLRELADLAHAVSARNLALELDQPGDLPEAVRGMIAHLRELVIEIRETSAQVVTGAEEIAAAAVEQEQVAIDHELGVAQISERLGFLARSAQDINARANGVLENAERSASRADDMGARVEELRAQAAGITEVLELIQDIAGRSDLLALNGSLEATRAGEAGRGFALVAAEMRRLAERVTLSVGQVRERVVAIEAAGDASVGASVDSRELAKGSSLAAREIVSLTGRQGEDTQGVSQELEGMASSVAAASVVTSQTRAAALGLRERAKALDELTKDFELE